MADLKALARRLYEDMSTTDPGSIDEFIDRYMAEDFVEHEPIPGMDNTRETPRQFFKMVLAAFPDFRMNVQDLIQEGDKVVARLTFTGTHQGEFMGEPASGNKIEVNVIDIVRFRDDQMIEHWGITDTAAMMEQMGATAPPS